MIPITKGVAPAELVRDGERHAEELSTAFDASPDLYLTGTLRLVIRDSIYTSTSVKTELQRCHHGKCCYCEKQIPKPYAYAHVEHWRPKSASRQERKTARLRPGYYWLAYDWGNLLWSCAFCNGVNKSDLFPLEDATMRARHHRMDLDRESPLLLKPDGDLDPREHITFRQDTPEGITPLGRTTIQILRLDSLGHEARRTHYSELSKAREMLDNFLRIDDPYTRLGAKQIREFLEAADKPEKEYSAMAAVFLRMNPLPVQRD